MKPAKPTGLDYAILSYALTSTVIAFMMFDEKSLGWGVTMVLLPAYVLAIRAFPRVVREMLTKNGK